MQLDTLIVKNFQCFGPDGIALDMTDPVTTMIGANGSGKTALFQALNRWFGRLAEGCGAGKAGTQDPSDPR